MEQCNKCHKQTDTENMFGSMCGICYDEFLEMDQADYELWQSKNKTCDSCNNKTMIFYVVRVDKSELVLCEACFIKNQE